MYYLLIILICSIVIYIPNALVNPANINLPWVYYLLAVIIYVLASVLVDGIVAFIIRRLPSKLIKDDKFPIRLGKKEEALFKKIKVDKWKKFMPDLGAFTKFPKGQITDPKNNEYISRFILEAGYGVIIHYVSVFTAPLILLLGFIDRGNLATLTVGIPVMIVNIVLILLPALALKYNLPKLKRIYEINLRRANKKVLN